MNYKSMIVDLADDDYTGLWELIWRAETITDKMDAQNVVARLRSDVEALMREGKLALFQGTRFAGEEEPVAATDAPTLLHTPQSWSPPALGDTHLRVIVVRPKV